MRIFEPCLRSGTLIRKSTLPCCQHSLSLDFPYILLQPNSRSIDPSYRTRVKEQREYFSLCLKSTETDLIPVPSVNGFTQRSPLIRKQIQPETIFPQARNPPVRGRGGERLAGLRDPGVSVRNQR